MNIIGLNDWQEQVLDSDKPVLVDFFATWCPPCKLLAPTLEALAQERTDIKIVKVNVDEEEDLAIQHNIRFVPTVVLYKDGKVVTQASCNMTREQLLAKFGL